MTVLPSKQTSVKPSQATSEPGASQVALVLPACTSSSLDQQWISILGASCLVEQTINTWSQEKRKLTKFTHPQSKELSRRLKNWLIFAWKHVRAKPGQKAHFYENRTHCQLNMAPTQLRGKTGFHCSAGSELAWNRTFFINQDHWAALDFFVNRDSRCIIWDAITSSWCMETFFSVQNIQFGNVLTKLSHNCRFNEKSLWWSQSLIRDTF